MLLVFIFRLLFMVLCHIFHEQNGGTIDKFNYDKLRSNVFLSFEGKNDEWDKRRMLLDSKKYTKISSKRNTNKSCIWESMKSISKSTFSTKLHAVVTHRFRFRLSKRYPDRSIPVWAAITLWILHAIITNHLWIAYMKLASSRQLLSQKKFLDI